jgi:hypothetical protein
MDQLNLMPQQILSIEIDPNGIGFVEAIDPFAYVRV